MEGVLRPIRLDRFVDGDSDRCHCDFFLFIARRARAGLVRDLAALSHPVPRGWKWTGRWPRLQAVHAYAQPRTTERRSFLCAPTVHARQFARPGETGSV